jgi:MYXO-CTERM domain-containing protein
MPRSRHRARHGLLALALLAACGGDDAPRDAPGRLDGSSLRVDALVATLAAPVPATATERGFLVRAALPATAARSAPTLRAELGRAASDPIRVVASPGVAVSVRRRAASPAAGHLVSGAVVYEDVQPGVDSLTFSTGGGVEELVVARRAGASIAYDLDLPPGYHLHRSAVPGLVEIRDGHATARLRLRVKRAWDAGGRDVPVEPIVEGAGRVRVAVDEARVGAWPVVIDPEWTLATDLTIPRYQHTATMLPDGRVLIAGGDTAEIGLVEIYDPSTNTFTSAGRLIRRRANHTATLLSSGKVLLAGGDSGPAWDLLLHDVTGTVEVFDPAAGTFTFVQPLFHARTQHTATRMAHGKVLFAGGMYQDADASARVRADAEVYDGEALTAAKEAIPLDAKTGRANHAAVALPDGRVILAGGGTWQNDQQVAFQAPSVEAFDPEAQAFSPVADLAGAIRPTATLLPSGRVLLASTSGFDLLTPSASSGALQHLDGVAGHCDATCTATRLPSGRVLLAGGTEVNGQGPTLDVVTLFDERGPAARLATRLAVPREYATATLLSSGLVLIAGGFDRAAGAAAARAELYDPGDARLESTGAMLESRDEHTMTALPGGEVLVAGGAHDGGLAGAEVWNPETQVFRAVGLMVKPRAGHTATTLPPPPPLASPAVLIAGGYVAPLASLADVERYDPATEWFFAETPMLVPRQWHGAVPLGGGSVLFLGGPSPLAERWALGGNSALAGQDVLRWRPTVTALQDGRVLVVGGASKVPSGPTLGAVSVWANDQFTALEPLEQPLAGQAAARLGDGRVLLAGGAHGMAPATADVSLFDPATNTCTPGPTLGAPRDGDTATPLADGRVLLVGGADAAVLYDPSTGPVTIASPPAVGGHGAAATQPDGRVILTGGGRFDGVSAGAVVYDPTDQTFETFTARARSFHTATLLPSGDLLFTGGIDAAGSTATDQGAGTATASADRFDPRTRTFKAIEPPMAEARLGHTATLVPDGRVILAGGVEAFDFDNLRSPRNTFEIWTEAGFAKGGELAAARAHHTATLLADGRILLTGGVQSAHLLRTAEILDPATGTSRRTAGALLTARYRHAAARLPSGRVLIAGGITLDPDHPYAGKPLPTVEIYDPATEVFTELDSGTALVPGDARAVVLPSGEVLVVGDKVAYRFDETDHTLTAIGSAPTSAFGAGVLPGGRLLVCGLDRCDAASGGAVPDGAQRVGHSLTALPGGEIFALGFTPAAARHTFSYRPFPPDAPRPTITAGQQALHRITAGAAVTLAGARFQHLSARGTLASLPGFPDILPQVSFIPAATGSPLAAAVQSWSDTAITFTAPRTPYTGGGWLVVHVDGVPSEGAWTILEPAPQGDACTLDGECATKHCIEGVCCDRACGGGCQSCLARLNGGAEGECAPRHVDAAALGGCVCSSTLECPSDAICLPEGRCGPLVDPGADAGCACRAGTRSSDRTPAAAALLALLVLAARRRAQNV